MSEQLVIDTSRRRVVVGGRRPVVLPRMQFELLVYLARDPTRVVSTDELLREVWGYRQPGRTRTVDQHVLRTRRALGNGFLRTIRCQGYVLSEDPSLVVLEYSTGDADRYSRLVAFARQVERTQSVPSPLRGAARSLLQEVAT